MDVGSDAWNDFLLRHLQAIQVHADRGQIQLLAAHARLLLEWNRRVNLTAVTHPQDLALKHYVDSALPLTTIPSQATLLDMGTGAGFPGIPLKILNPNLRVVLIDASRKKISFLNHFIRNSGLVDIEARHIRAENMGDRDYRGPRFDVIISRAFSKLAKFIALAQPLVASNGAMIAMKGKMPRSEIEELRRAEKTRQRPPLIMEAKEYLLPGLDAARTIIRVTQHEAL